MVVFTCQNCGSSLAKNKVEKHLSFECKKPPHLTCVDCFKDFRHQEYVKHTECVTESERYGSKDYVPKVSSNTKKRATWLTSAHAAVETPGLTEEQKKLMHLCLGFKNLPQKKNKFYNFISNCMNKPSLNEDLVNSVFDIFAKTHAEKLKEEKENDATNGNKNVQGESKTDSSADVTNGDNFEKPKKKRQQRCENGEEEEVDVRCPEESGVVKEKKKKQKNKKMEVDDSLESQESVDSQANESGSTNNVDMSNGNDEMDEQLENGHQNVKKLSKKEKKKKQKNAKMEDESFESEETVDPQSIESGSTNNVDISNANGEMDVETENGHQQDRKLSKKERKEKKKREKYEAELNEIKNVDKDNDNSDNKMAVDNNSENENGGKKQKKKKDKNKHCNGNNLDGNVTNENEGKEKKKRRYEETVVDEPIKKRSKADSDNQNETNEEESVNDTSFNWEEIIIKVLEKRSDREMALNRLSKKIVNEYFVVHGETHMTFEKLMAKFNKKIRRIPGVKVFKDKAKLVTSQ